MKLYEPINVDKIIDYREDGVNPQILLENNQNKAIIIAIKKGQELQKHISETSAFLYVIEGEVIFKTDENEYEIKKEELFAFEKEKPHSVCGKKDSKILVVRI